MNPKLAMLRMAQRTGLSKVLASTTWRKEQLLILCYHGVSTHDEHLWNPELYVTTGHLRQRLSWLREHGYNVLQLNEALDRLSAGSLPSRSVALTFDDGAADFATRGVPVLREFNTPATVYLTSHYAQHAFPVFNTAFSYVMWRASDAARDLNEILPLGAPTPVAGNESRRKAFERVQKYMAEVGLDSAAKDGLLREIAAYLGVSLEHLYSTRMLHIMTSEQVSALPRDLIDVQVHTHRHRTPRSAIEFRKEIEDNRRAIQACGWNHSPLVHFCYPSGDYSAMFLPWLREIGMKSATTCVPGLASRDSDPLLLPRFIDTMDTPDIVFESWCMGIASLLPRRRANRLDKDRG